MQTAPRAQLGVGEILAAYAQLAESDPGPLARLLDPDVEWIEYMAARELRRTAGADEVVRLLAECCDAGARPALIGAAKHGDEVQLEFAAPWWRQRGVLGRLESVAPASAVQRLRLEGRIVRIESFSSRFASR